MRLVEYLVETGKVFALFVSWALLDSALLLQETRTFEVPVVVRSAILVTLDSTLNLFYVIEILLQYAGLDAYYINLV